MAAWSPLLPFEPGDVLGGKYRIERLLGQGGMGAVLAAHHLHLDEPVALKVMLSSQDVRPDAIHRFLREARAAAKIKSEHVARVIDVGTLDNGLPFLVMELLEGEDLGDRLRRAGPRPVGEAASLLIDACDAIGEAHAKGIVHRDLKPSNLFLARRHDGRMCLKVLDFGISKIAGGPGDGLQTASRSIMGTPFYMAPEQMLSSGRVDGRADIWSLGATLYELLCGEPPFVADDITIVVARVLHEEPPPLASRRPDLPAPIVAVVERCLRKEPDRRFPDVAALAEALAPFAQLELEVDPVGVTFRTALVSRPDAPTMSTPPDGPTLATPPEPLPLPASSTLASASAAGVDPSPAAPRPAGTGALRPEASDEAASGAPLGAPVSGAARGRGWLVAGALAAVGLLGFGLARSAGHGSKEGEAPASSAGAVASGPAADVSANSTTPTPAPSGAVSASAPASASASAAASPLKVPSSAGKTGAAPASAQARPKAPPTKATGQPAGLPTYRD